MTEPPRCKLGIVQKLFVATADQYYITARWAYQNELNIDFFWLATHAMETYLKAVFF